MRLARTLSPGHPDRACDIIAETVVDEYLRRDPSTRIRVHVTGGKGALFVTGIVSSKADFDVGSIAARAAGALGARKPIEPFVAIESVGMSGLAQMMRHSGPVSVAGYATHETLEQMPSIVMLSRRAAKLLNVLRAGNAEWFWFEPGYTVDVAESVPGSFRLTVSCGHGERPLAEVRDQIRNVLRPVTGDAEIRVNAPGPHTEESLDHDIGSSGTPDEPYGTSLPVQSSIAGIDFYHPKKFGAWLARSLARQALSRSDAKAVLVRAVYEPGENAPAWFSVRDERGRDLSASGDRDLLRDLSLATGLRNGLNADAARWGFAGETGMPWEG